MSRIEPADPGLSPGDDPAKVLHELMAGAGFPVSVWLDDEPQTAAVEVG